MALSKCGSCGHGRFEVKEVSPNNSRYRLYFVQCASCGVPVGVQEYHNIGAQIAPVTQTLDGLGRQLQDLEYQIRQISQAVQRLQR